MLLLRSYHDIYRLLLMDYTDGSWAGPTKKISEAEAKSVVCWALDNAGDDTWLEKAQRGDAFVSPSSKSQCNQKGPFEIRIPGEGSVLFARLDSGNFVQAYEPPARSTEEEVRNPSTRLYPEGGLVVTERKRTAIVCSSNPEDDCVPSRPDVEALFCSKKQAERCKPAGFESEVSVLDPASGLSVAFGPFRSQHSPAVTVRSLEVTVATDACKQVHQFKSK